MFSLHWIDGGNAQKILTTERGHLFSLVRGSIWGMEDQEEGSVGIRSLWPTAWLQMRYSGYMKTDLVRLRVTEEAGLRYRVSAEAQGLSFSDWARRALDRAALSPIEGATVDEEQQRAMGLVSSQ